MRDCRSVVEVSDMLRMTTYLTFILASALSIAGCGGGGGSSPSTPATTHPTASVSGDMLAVAASRGWNYHGEISGQALTITLYAVPSSSGATPLVALVVFGTLPDATNGEKLGELAVTNSSGTYAVTNFTLYNGASICAQGELPGGSQLVLGTLTLGQTFTPYPGMSAKVTAVGSVPGANGCPNPAPGATVQYSFLSQTYEISYVPGCGITQYVGNHGETFTLVSIGNYPQLGTAPGGPPPATPSPSPAPSPTLIGTPAPTPTPTLPPSPPASETPPPTPSPSSTAAQLRS